MKHFFFAFIMLCSLLLLKNNLKAQTIATTESRCINTGTVTISGAVGAGGPYQVSITTAPADYINTGIHSVANLPEEFNALYPGSYTMKVIDQDGTSFIFPFTITGNYVLPGNNDYQPATTAVTNCASPDGTIQGVLSNGRPPYNYTIVSGPEQVGVTNATGTFTGLIAGTYQVQAGDSCQNIQTRVVTVVSNTPAFTLSNPVITKVGCDSFNLTALTVSPSFPVGGHYEVIDYDDNGGTHLITKGTTLPLGFTLYHNNDIQGGWVQIIVVDGCGDSARIQPATVNNVQTYTITGGTINKISCDSFSLDAITVSPSLPAGVTYQLIDHAFSHFKTYPVTTSLPIHFSAADQDVTGGYVEIVVFDSCGVLTRTDGIRAIANDWNITSPWISQDCTNGVVLHNTPTTGTIPAPYTVTVQPYYIDASGNTIYITPPQTVTGYPYTLTGVDGTTNPLYTNTAITDACGVTKQVGTNLSYSIAISGTQFNDCLTTRTDIYPIVGDTSTSGPITYSISPNAGTGSRVSGGYSFIVPDGDYTITAKDACGKIASLQVTADHRWQVTAFGQQKICDIGYIQDYLDVPSRATPPITVYQYLGAQPVTGTSTLVNTKVVADLDSACAACSATDANAGEQIQFDSTLPARTYTYIVMDACGRADTISITNDSIGHQPLYHKTWVQNECINKGNIIASWNSDDPDWNAVWVQVWNEKDPSTILLYSYTYGEGEGSTNIPQYPNGQPILTDQPVGTYIVQYGINSCGGIAYDTVTISPYVQPKVTTVQSFTPCSGGGSPVIVTGTGDVGPYMYEIVNSTPDHYTASQQTSSVFVLPTTQTTVTVRVLDACLNSTTRTVAVTKATAPFIRTTPSIVTTCALPLNYTLYTDSLYDGSVFAWTKLTGAGADSTVIIGTSPSLPLTFNSIADTGTYQVRVTVPGTCFDVSSRFTVSNIIVTCAPAISGNVFHDANGLTDSIVNGTGTNVGGTLNAILVNSSNKVVATTVVANNGSYSFTNIFGDTYSVVLSITAGTINAAPPAPSLPSNWVNTGEHLGTTAGNDGTVNGILTNIIVSGTVDAKSVTDADFGIEQPPTANNVSSTPQSNPGGTIQVTVPTLNGNDPEDGTYDGISDINTVVINTLPANGILYYNNSPVTVGQVITNYDPTKLTVDPNDGAITVTFTYSEVDAAGVQSTAATVTMPFTLATTLSVKVISFTATAQGSNSLLQWITGNEINTTSFIIEDSIDANSWQQIGTVNAKANSSMENNYSFTDYKPAAGINYYRLKMINNDGSYSYSAIRIVNFSGSDGFTLIPNPANDNVVISLKQLFSNKVDVSVINAQGQPVLQDIINSNEQKHSMKVENLPAGVYKVVLISNGNTIYVQQLVIQK